MSPRLETEHLYKVFGGRPDYSVARLRQGADREELRAAGTTAAVIDASGLAYEKDPANHIASRYAPGLGGHRPERLTGPPAGVFIPTGESAHAESGEAAHWREP